MRCSSCDSENEAGRKFCGECGSPLALPCPACGALNGPTVKFCGECGARFADARVEGRPLATGTAGREVPTEERRLVSVLFADLVGFTALSESRDAEQVRDLLSRYFETCNRLIRRYGGVVEKFIGDAVMAVWGSPVATEDDAERAVRASLDLVAAVEAFGVDVGAPGLRARAGVLTGEAAVSLGAEAESMVMGDMVNTASRIQSAAEPGTVLVGGSTRWATDAAIAYTDAGVHELKGKAEPIPLWRAIRVISGTRGQQRAVGLEPPFVGRERELRLVKETFHASADESRAHLVSVMGPAGIGKSRLAWELYKYFDGLADTVNWHLGRCPSYGDGVAYWALAEMVRMRCRIAEEEFGESAMSKLTALLGEEVPDPEERDWIAPRLAGLVGLEDGAVGGREELFSAWRLFFERLADRDPTVMVFEDVQWADSSLLDFIEYILDWSRNSRLFIMTLARPELAERRPNWGAGRRNFTSIYLEPLSEENMHDLLAGLVPGLPEEIEGKILERAQGVPLYAVETVRMLLDRALLIEEGSAYRPAGPIGSLDVPDTLHALIAARLDGLDPQERLVVQDGSVLGKTFFKEGVVAISGLPEEELGPILEALVRKEVLTLQSDPRSPERGQYGFLQDLVKQVAYETISKKERKSKHLAAASFIRESWQGDEDEVVEIVASHYLQAYELDLSAMDAASIKAEARDMLEKAGERASSLGASHEGQMYFEKALELADQPLDRAGLAERAGVAATALGRPLDAQRHFEQAIVLFESEGRTHPAARVSARLAEALWDEGHIEDGIRRMERAYEVLATDEPDEDLAVLTHQLARMALFAGNVQACAERVEVALEIAEHLWFPEVLSHALNTKSLALMSRGRVEEADALLRRALDIATEHDLPQAAFRAYYNLFVLDDLEENEGFVRRGLELSQRMGNRTWEVNFIGRLVDVLWLRGDWDGAVRSERVLLEEGVEQGIALSRALAALAHLHVNRGELDRADQIVALRESARGSAGVIERLDYEVGVAIVARARGDFAEARRATDDLLAATVQLGLYIETLSKGCLEALEVDLAQGHLEHVEELIERFRAQSSRRGQLYNMLPGFEARLAAARGEPARADQLFREATGTLRAYGAPFPLAAVLLEHAELLVSEGNGARAVPLLNEARDIFERLRATPWLERIESVTARASRSA